MHDMCMSVESGVHNGHMVCAVRTCMAYDVMQGMLTVCLSPSCIHALGKDACWRTASAPTSNMQRHEQRVLMQVAVTQSMRT